jgi:hypothetical protein
MPWWEQDAQKANAGGRKAAGKQNNHDRSLRRLFCITGRIPGLVPGCESRLTWGGCAYEGATPDMLEPKGALDTDAGERTGGQSPRLGHRQLAGP